MKQLKNWDNKTWLASDKYISSFHKFLKTKIKINKNVKILDIGCGRANIISFLHKKYKFIEKPIGVDLIKNSNIRKNIIFKKIDAIKYLNKNDNFFDMILIKQTIHFFSNKKIITLLDLCKKRLNVKGVVLILSLKTKNNQIPSFKLMKKKLDMSFKKDDQILVLVKRNFKTFEKQKFRYKVIVKKNDYIKMIKNRFISCLITLSKKEILDGIKEIRMKFKALIKFEDILECIIFRK
tara:strand:+ start:756 stop:1466 length:711 start_codon:yes stop_codon:yes gene_type:complete